MTNFCVSFCVQFLHGDLAHIHHSVSHFRMPRPVGLWIVVVIIIAVVGTSVQLVRVAVVVITSTQIEQSIIRVGQICVNGLLTLRLLLLFACRCLIWSRRCRWSIVTRWWCIGSRRDWRIGGRAVSWRRIFRWLRCYGWIEIGWWWARGWHVWWIEGILLLTVLLLLVWRDWRRARICLVALRWVVWLICVWPVGACNARGRSFRAEFSLRHKTLQMWHESKAKRVLNVHSLDRNKVPCDFWRTLSKANNVIIHRKALRIESDWIDAWEK